MASSRVRVDQGCVVCVDPVVTNGLAYHFTKPTRELMVVTMAVVPFLAKQQPMDTLKVVFEGVMLGGERCHRIDRPCIPG